MCIRDSAYVLYSEGIYDREYVDRWVEPDGFEAWRRYVMGETDGIPKTPEWAEPITALPAETIRGFANLYATCLLYTSAARSVWSRAS